MSTLREAQDILRRVGAQADAEIDLAEAALAFAAQETPEPGFGRYRHHLSLLIRDVADVFADTRAERTEPDDRLTAQSSALSWVLAERYGYIGDQETYDDLQNANLMRVIDRRKGLPVALAILYLHTARAQGWRMVGLNFPGHFLVRLEVEGARTILDPFNALSPLSPAELRALIKQVGGDGAELAPEYTEALSNREILLRLQNNRKMRLLQDKRTEQALQTLEAMLMVAPAHAALWREAGLLQMHLGNLRAAILALEQVVDLSDDAAVRNEAVDLLEQIRTRIN